MGVNKHSPGCLCCGEGCPCGSALWIWDDGASEWNVGTSSCTGACVAIEPTSPGTVDLEEETTCCANGCFGVSSVSSGVTPADLSDTQIGSRDVESLTPGTYELAAVTRLSDRVTYTEYDVFNCFGWSISAQRIKTDWTDLGGGGGDKTYTRDWLVWTKGTTGPFFGDYRTTITSYIYDHGGSEVFPEGTGSGNDIDSLAVGSYPFSDTAGIMGTVSVGVTGPSPVPNLTEPYAESSSPRYDWVQGYSASVA